jgi:myosin heavy subunit
MANDTIVQYVLKVDAKGAQQALDRTGQEAKEASQSFTRLETSSTQAVQGLRRVEQQAKQTSKGARNLRKAGRDLDGAFADLGQGAAAVSPALGSLFFTISDGASVAEAAGRGLTGFLNPAFAITAGVAVIAGAAIFEFQREAEEAQKRSEELARITEETNKAIEQQSKAAQSAADSLVSYYEEVEQARFNLELLSGQLTQFEADQRSATATANQFAQNATQAQQEQKAALEETISARNIQINQLRSEIGLLREQRAIQQSLSERIAGVPQQFEAATGEEKALQKRLDKLRESQQADQQRLQVNQDQITVIGAQRKAYEDILKEQARIAEQDRQRAAAERRRQQALREEAELERQFAELERQQEERAQRAYKARLETTKRAVQARQQIDQVILTTQRNSLSAVDRINAEYNDQINAVRELARLSGAENAAQNAINALLEERDRKLFDIAAKEQEITAEQKKRDEEQKKRDRQQRQDDVSEIISKVAVVASLDAAGIVSLINPIAGQIVSVLQEIGSTTPEEKREEIKAQVDAIRLGISFLPEIFLQLVPLLAVGILEAFYDGILLFGRNLVKIISDSFKAVFNFRDRDPDGNRADLGVGSALRRFFDPDQQTFMSGGRFIPKAQGGIRFTGMQDGLAMLHRGEFVVPQSGQRPQQVDRQMSGVGGGMVVNINSAVVDRNAVDALVREIEIRFNNQFGTSSSSLFGGR